MTTDLKSRIDEAAAAVRAKSALRPKVGIILGTGLGDFADALNSRVVIPTARSRTFRSRRSRATPGSFILASSPERRWL